VVSNVWYGPGVGYGAVIRGDVNSIKIGSLTNIQDNTVIHVAKTNVGGHEAPTLIGDRVTVGHNATLHACTIEDDAFVGMGATVMDGAVVEKGAMVGRGRWRLSRHPLALGTNPRCLSLMASHDDVPSIIWQALR